MAYSSEILQFHYLKELYQQSGDNLDSSSILVMHIAFGCFLDVRRFCLLLQHLVHQTTWLSLSSSSAFTPFLLSRATLASASETHFPSSSRFATSNLYPWVSCSCPPFPQSREWIRCQGHVMTAWDPSLLFNSRGQLDGIWFSGTTTGVITV